MFTKGQTVMVAGRGIHTFQSYGEEVSQGVKCHLLTMNKTPVIYYDYALSEYAPPPVVKKPDPVLIEWKDPGTGEVHVCPEHYIAGLKTHVGVGLAAATRAGDLLKLMGEENTESNKRHVRQAALYLKQNGTPVIAYRSSKGGYFIAQTQQEITDYVAQQHKLADSMKSEADALAAMFANI